MAGDIAITHGLPRALAAFPDEPLFFCSPAPKGAFFMPELRSAREANLSRPSGLVIMGFAFLIEACFGLKGAVNNKRKERR